MSVANEGCILSKWRSHSPFCQPVLLHKCPIYKISVVLHKCEKQKKILQDPGSGRKWYNSTSSLKADFHSMSLLHATSLRHHAFTTLFMPRLSWGFKTEVACEKIVPCKSALIPEAVQTLLAQVKMILRPDCTQVNLVKLCLLLINFCQHFWVPCAIPIGGPLVPNWSDGPKRSNEPYYRAQSSILNLLAAGQ